MTTETHLTDVTDVVKRKYGEIAKQVAAGQAGTCCGPSECGCGGADPITDDLYDGRQVRELPPAALRASLGCGNPTALAELKPGETVLDLGSGGGIDVLLSARRVGPTGKAYGLDMTDEMLALARQNQRAAGADNVEFLKGQIEAIPLPDASVDVIISNCVVNLSADKDAVFAEAWRVLKPGGRLAISDVVRRRAVRPELARSIELWVGCVAGALEESDYRARLADVGFVGIDVEPTRVYHAADAAAFLAEAGFDPDEVAPEVDGAFMSAFVRATR
jgi:SAM-dependent methyltransferase